MPTGIASETARASASSAAICTKCHARHRHEVERGRSEQKFEVRSSKSGVSLARAGTRAASRNAPTGLQSDQTSSRRAGALDIDLIAEQLCSAIPNEKTTTRIPRNWRRFSRHLAAGGQLNVDAPYTHRYRLRAPSPLERRADSHVSPGPQNPPAAASVSNPAASTIPSMNGCATIDASRRRIRRRPATFQRY